MNVANRKCIRRLSIANMKAKRSRNIIAVIAIALTTVLFTSLFTVLMSVAYGFEQSNFRQVGGYEHGGLKYLTEEQVNEFKDDKRIAEYGTRLFLGAPYGEPFNKVSVEVSSPDENYTKFTFVDFAEGGLPKENSNEAAADSRVLELLGIDPEIGTEFTLTFFVNEVTEVTETFTLCGWWECDRAMPSSHVFLPFSRSREIIDRCGASENSDSITGTYSLDFMLKSGSFQIEKNIIEMIEEHGYQCIDARAENYIDYGVNWGYLNAQADGIFDMGTALAIAVLLLLIVFSGYLIIYNVFRISVSNDVRYYGLLKTIGTTGTQIKRIINIQAMALSAAGIPIGLIIGYGVGAAVSPVVISQLNEIENSLSANPVIFIFSAVFSLGTVLLSCSKPGNTAAKISPVEAVRYTESGGGKASVRKAKKGASVTAMAAANLSRGGSRTVTTILSLALSALLLNLTVTFANGFDMDKYLRTMPADFIIADAGYFRVSDIWWEEMALPESAVSDITVDVDTAGIGVTYGNIKSIRTYAPAEHIIEKESRYYGNEGAEEYVKYRIPNEDGLYSYHANIYGMDKFCLDKMTVIDGDISKLYGDGKYIAAVYMDDDYGKPIEESCWAKVGDKVTIVYEDSDENIWTDSDGNVYELGQIMDIPEGKPRERHSKEEHSVTYEVAATVTVPHALSYRYYGSDQYILGSEIFKRDTGTDKILYTAFDVTDGAEEAAESFISDYTNRINTGLNYESKKTYEDDFASFRNMFLLLGGVLSFIVGLIGILNFANAVLTGIFARRRELAVLQSIGMTGTQLKEMLITEGLYYTVGAAAGSLVLAVVFSPLTKTALEGLFWFFSFKFTVLPILILIPVFGILGAVIPLVSYENLAKKSVVERLRETE